MNTVAAPAVKKDKQKVEDEKRSDEQLAFFLKAQPPVGVNRDYHVLVLAYRSMKPDEFARFVPLFKASGLDVNAVGPQGKTVAQVIADHRYGQAYLPALLESAPT